MPILLLKRQIIVQHMVYENCNLFNLLSGIKRFFFNEGKKLYLLITSMKCISYALIKCSVF